MPDRKDFVSDQGGRPTSALDVALQALTVDEFCTLNRISRSLYYCLKRTGRGPREMHVGGRKLITQESNRDWRKDREEATAAASEMVAA